MWTSNPKRLPAEYQELVLCRTFGWTPSQLDQEDSERIDLLLAMMGVENRVNEARAKAAKG